MGNNRKTAEFYRSSEYGDASDLIQDLVKKDKTIEKLT